MAITVMINAIAITAAEIVNASIIMINTSLIVRRELYTSALIRQGNLSENFIVFLVLDQKITNIIYCYYNQQVAWSFWCVYAKYSARTVVFSGDVSSLLSFHQVKDKHNGRNSQHGGIDKEKYIAVGIDDVARKPTDKLRRQQHQRAEQGVLGSSVGLVGQPGEVGNEGRACHTATQVISANY